jgi:hypothetical protein
MGGYSSDGWTGKFAGWRCWVATARTLWQAEVVITMRIPRIYKEGMQRSSVDFGRSEKDFMKKTSEGLKPSEV